MTMDTIRLVDLQHLEDDAKLPLIASEIATALRESGFMYVKNHGIPENVIDNLRQQQQRFFNLPDASKALIAINESNRGYLGQGKARMHGAARHDQKEVFFWGAELATDHPHRVARLPLCGANQWPSEPAGFYQAVIDYATAIAKLGDNLLRGIALALELPRDFFAPFYLSAMTRGQLIHYPPTEGGEDDFGVAPHTDFGCITLLLQQTAGLEVLSRSGEWIAAPPIDNTLIINIGDLLERWTDGRLPSTRHRVRNTTGDERYSIAMFHDPDATAVVNPDDMRSNSSKYEAVTAADYISGRNKGAFAHYGKIDEAKNTT